VERLIEQEDLHTEENYQRLNGLQWKGIIQWVSRDDVASPTSYVERIMISRKFMLRKDVMSWQEMFQMHFYTS